MSDSRFSTSWALVLPALAVTAVCFAVPVANVLRLSFVEPAAGFGNYVELVAEPLYRSIAATTLRMALATTAISVLLGYLVAYVIAHTAPRHRQWLLLAVLMPFWLSVLVRAFAWVVLLQREGLVNAALMSLGLVDQPLALLRNETGVLIGMVHYMVPYAVLPLLSTMMGIDHRLVPAARACGAGPVRSFLKVFLPLSLPGIVAATILVFILSLGFLVTPALLGGGKVVMVAQYIEFGISETLNWGIATALATCLLMLVVFSLALVAKLVPADKLFGAK
ncbi:ABC transporter permease [Phreatobacter sp. AB_2022a]|uniref:ABC transporter permease n=1 Tax=Phreatobacter sp. AB_2022a TaxID=3003134 RepID=UPI002286EEAA|nr:ABC transporter permease [Phreatobacter sp. AB_2022a]MCZ0735667.1 ABC transporter permease [Phreatobacter sp. AB_2022a]